MIVAKMSRKHRLLVSLLTYGVAVHGLLMIAGTLAAQWEQHASRHGLHLSGFELDLPLLFGLSLLYLSVLLRRRKRTAWFVTFVLYGAILALGLMQVVTGTELPNYAFDLVRLIGLPLVMVVGLWYFKDDFEVRSDLRNFAVSLRFIVLVLSVAFVYGVVGFTLMDRHDFHQEITVTEAAHRTIDQFDLTTTHTLEPHTRRAKLFLDSLTVVSTGAVIYAVVSLFQPIRARLVDVSTQRALAGELLERYHGNSEDYFKLWPQDKLYFFNLSHTAGVAYRVHRGVALVVGDPFGKPDAYQKLLASFIEYCRTNDWRPAFVHTEPKYNSLYTDYDFELQKIGEEAIVDLNHFVAKVRKGKYFRQIGNRFEKHGYSAEMLQPPHNQAVLARLQAISKDWLSLPGREERGFLMGYYSAEYMQQGPVMVLRDAAGTIQAFVNQVHSFKPGEANYDLLRHTHDSLGNINDYLLMQFIDHLRDNGFTHLNMGLCPFSGMEEVKEGERSMIDRGMRLLYAKGDRLYSFSGLRRFKSKYEPEWSTRYVVYKGGLRSFTRVVAAFSSAVKR